MITSANIWRIFTPTNSQREMQMKLRLQKTDNAWKYKVYNMVFTFLHSPKDVVTEN